jgi:hypothetical protein
MNGVWHKSPATRASQSSSEVIEVVVVVLCDFIWAGECLRLGWSQGNVGRCPCECAFAGHEWQELKWRSKGNARRRQSWEIQKEHKVTVPLSPFL